MIDALLAVAGSVYNGYAANENANYQRTQLRKQRSLNNQQYQFGMKKIGQQYDKGVFDIASGGQASSATLAQGGAQGSGALRMIGANANNQTQQLDQWNANAITDLNFTKQAQDLQYKSAVDQIEAGRTSGIFNAFAGAFGAALGAGGDGTKMGWFDALFKQPDKAGA